MCGRFTQKSERKIITEQFYIQEFLSNVYISYNIAPGQNAGVIIQDTVNRYVQYKWGLVPFWAKDPKIGYRMINARAETLTEKPSFKKAFEQRRCLIPADGFYEWKKIGTSKIPYYIFHQADNPMSFAGLWEKWKPPEGSSAEMQFRGDRSDGDIKKSPPRPGALRSEEVSLKSDASEKYPVANGVLYTFTIITTEAHTRLQDLHDRMPVIIPPDKMDLWLQSGNKNIQELIDLLKPSSQPELDFHEVSRFVNSPQNNSPECIVQVKGT